MKFSTDKKASNYFLKKEMEDARSQKEKDDEVLAYLSGKALPESETTSPPFFETEQQKLSRSISTDNISQEELLLWQKLRNSTVRNALLSEADSSSYPQINLCDSRFSAHQSQAALFFGKSASEIIGTGHGPALDATGCPSEYQPFPPKRRRIYPVKGGGVARQKWATREIAALEFLSSIPMQQEAKIMEHATCNLATSPNSMGWNRNIKDHKKSLSNGVSDEDDEALLSDNDLADYVLKKGYSNSGPGRRLDGPEVTNLKVPYSIRYGLSSMHHSAEIRQWEKNMIKHGVLSGRLFLSGNKGYPVSVCSIIRYEPGEDEAKRRRDKWADERGGEVFAVPKRDWRGFSYSYLLSATGHEESTNQMIHSSHIHHVEDLDQIDFTSSYEPGFLDDPAMSVGRHKHLLTGDDHTGPIVCSILQFVKPKELKEDLNRQFRQKHHNLPPSLTLSKIRSIKRQALIGCHRIGLEVVTVALACIYFERLCLSGAVNKTNRRLAMAACLVLAYKFNEPLTISGISSRLPALWSFIDNEWQVSKKDVLGAEFGILINLKFSLHENPDHVSYHFTLLLKIIEMNAREYLGETMMCVHQDAVTQFNGTDEIGRASQSSPHAVDVGQERIGWDRMLGAHNDTTLRGVLSPGANRQQIDNSSWFMRARQLWNRAWTWEYSYNRNQGH